MHPGRRGFAIGVACLVLGVFAAPASADVDTFTVNDDGEAVDANVGDGSCATAGAVCTLRAALQEANDNDAVGQTDVIGFSAGMVSSFIQLTSALPTHDEPISINGCSTALNSPGPCVGIRGLDTNTDAFLFATGATGVTVRGLSFANVDRGVGALSGTENLTVKNNHFGYGIAGTDPIRMGVQVSADGAVIGGTAGATGTSPADRNVFANASVGNGVGLSVFAGDDAVVQGNYFGINPSTGDPQPNDDNIEAAGTATNTAEDTLIGGTQPTPGTCSGPCNVISAATGDGIDLRSTFTEDAANTTIQGNFIGLNQTGSVVVSNQSGIRVVNAPGTLIGGTAAGTGNTFAGGATAISALFQGAPNLKIRNNRIGTFPNGTGPLGPPTGSAILVQSLENEGAEISGNTIATENTSPDAIQAQGADLLVSQNRIGVSETNQQLGTGSIGVRAVGLRDSTIESNVIGNFDLHGVSMENADGNTVRSNRIGVDAVGGSHPNAGDGIRITSFGAEVSTGNTIGGTLLAQENVISNNLGDGIGIVGDGNDSNSILRNRGGPNGADDEDLFIDMVGDDGEGNGAAGPNAGIEAPDLIGESLAKTVGLAAPGATVNSYVTADNQFSSLVGFAGTTTADSRGLFVATHTATPGANQGIGATQATAAGTSEVASTVSAALEGPDPTAPGAAVIAGPSGPTSDTTPTFTLDDPVNDPNFQVFICALDAGVWQPCADNPGSTHDIGPLADGAHTLFVAAVDEAANVSTTATRSFTVDTVAPSTTVTKAPKKKVTLKKKKVSVSFSFSSSEPGQGGFQCQLDNAEFVQCDSGSFSAKVKKGKHTFRVRAYDAAGNPDASLEIKTFTVSKKKKKKKK